MANKIYVLDANVFMEYIFNRPLQEKSKDIIRDSILENIEILLPSLVLDEITEVLCGNINDINEVDSHIRYIEKLAKEEIVQIVVPNTDVRTVIPGRSQSTAEELIFQSTKQGNW